jgi:hypothetical protein
MAWEVYEKIIRRSTSPTLTISKLGRISFNSAAAETLAKQSVSHVLLLWDKDAHKIGVRVVAKKDSRSYNVHYAPKNSSAGFAAKTFLHHIGYDYGTTKGYPCRWIEKESTYEVDVPAENFIHRFPRKGSEAHGQAKAAVQA